MAEPQDAPPPSDENLAPWERQKEKPTGSRPGGAGTGWHDARSPERGKRLQIAMAVTLFFVLAGVLAALFFTLKDPLPPIELLAVPVSQYRNIEWASNPTADADADELLKHFEQAGGRAAAAQQADKLRKLLANPNDAELRQNPGAPFVLFVSALAITRDGKAFVLPGDATLDGPDAAKSWIPFADVLAALEKCEAKDKALLLDLARSPADPFHGPLHDDVQAQIDREIVAFDPKFPVLASCSPGERSLVIPELRLSAFAAFLAEGLGGEADGYRAGEEPDQRITFAEVAEFTIARVSQWADGVPDVRQMPKRYGPDGSAFLLYRDRTRKPPPAEEAPATPPATPAYPAELKDGWKQRDAVRDLGAYLAPDLVYDLESRLLRAEGRYLAGLEIEDPRQDPAWNTAVTRLRARTTLWRGPMVSTLNELRAGRAAPKPELGIAIEKWMKLSFPPKDDTGKPTPVNMVELEKLTQEMDVILAGDAALDGFAFLWSRLVDDPTPNFEKLANLAAILERGKFANLPLSNERILVKRLGTSKLPSFAYPDAVRALLQSEAAFSAAIAATGGPMPEGFTRVRTVLNQGDSLKRQAEQALFKPRANSDEIEAARQQFKLGTDQLKLAANGATQLRIAHRAAADAAYLLHATLPAVIAWNKPDLDSWQVAARAGADLANKLAVDGPFEPREFEEVEALARKLRATLVPLTTHTPAQLKKLEEDAQQRPQASTYSELQKLLAGTTLGAEERAGIAAGFRKVSAVRFQAERAKFDKEHIRSPVEHAKWEDPFLRSARRASGSFERLRLAGMSQGPMLNIALQAAGKDEANWQSLADRSVSTWGRDVPAAAASDLKKNQWRSIERILRAAPPRLDGFNREEGFGKVFASEEVERRKWLALRFADYGILRAGVPGAPAFYAERAEDHDRPLAKVGN